MRIQESSDRLLEAYPKNLEDGLKYGLCQFSKFVKHTHIDFCSRKFKRFTVIKENNMETMFSNIQNFLGIYLCMMAKNCTGKYRFKN